MAAFDPKDIMETFEQAIELFNASDFEGLRPLFHPAIVWKLLHHAGSYGGVDVVINFLNANKKKLQPQFDPNPNTINVSPSQLTRDGSRRISGTAQWRTSKDSAPEDIDYIFTFLPDTAGRWLLADVFGHVIEPRLALPLVEARTRVIEETRKVRQETSD